MEKNIQTDRIEKLKSYLKRLGEGESLEAVRKDFAAEFQGVEASEIMKAEEAILAEGTPITEVQKLCDVHSALFHGTTDYSNKYEKSAALSQVKGHPLQTFTRENEALTKLIDRMKELLHDTDETTGSGSLPVDEKQVDTGNLPQIAAQLLKIREVAVHYAKKGDLLYPHLNARYGIAGPSAVMWTADDEIRDELGALCKALQKGREAAEQNATGSFQSSQWDVKWLERLQKVLMRAEEMIYKENHILFPNCAVNFTEEDWMGIYRDAKDYADCLGVHGEVWEEAENWLRKEKEAKKTVFKGTKDGQDSEGEEDRAGSNFSDGVIHMPGGHMTIRQLTALLNTIPLEISFIDAEDRNCYFNEGPKVFKRAQMALGRSVFTCHPPKVETMVRRIIGEFREGTLDRVPVWMDKGGRTMLVIYMAVRDESGEYMGTMELVQDMEFAKEHFGK
ncbi:putative uncharacterized protein [Clostridium sp. CAG:510]|nr:putative uncharacterized protein [Clostridium sp. CAG:510]